MSKNKGDIPAFAWHVAAESAIQRGWDYEEDLVEFLKGKMNGADECTHSNSSGAEVYLSDWLEALAGVYTDRFIAFWRSVDTRIKEQVGEGKTYPDVLMISMHSGSSDYFTKEMLADLLKGETHEQV